MCACARVCVPRHRRPAAVARGRRCRARSTLRGYDALGLPRVPLQGPSQPSLGVCTRSVCAPASDVSKPCMPSLVNAPGAIAPVSPAARRPPPRAAQGRLVSCRAAIPRRTALCAALERGGCCRRCGFGTCCFSRRSSRSRFSRPCSATRGDPTEPCPCVCGADLEEIVVRHGRRLVVLTAEHRCNATVDAPSRSESIGAVE